MRAPLLLAILFLGFISCSDRSIFDEILPVQKIGWHKDTAISFTFEVSDIGKKYNLFFCLRNDNQYEFSNLYVFYDLQRVKSDYAKGDTLQYMLSDGKGNWLGKGMTAVKENLFYYKKDFSFGKKGIYRISIKHGMRSSFLKGVIDVGLRITPVTAGK